MNMPNFWTSYIVPRFANLEEPVGELREALDLHPLAHGVALSQKTILVPVGVHHHVGGHVLANSVTSHHVVHVTSHHVVAIHVPGHHVVPHHVVVHHVPGPQVVARHVPHVG